MEFKVNLEKLLLVALQLHCEQSQFPNKSIGYSAL